MPIQPFAGQPPKSQIIAGFPVTGGGFGGGSGSTTIIVTAAPNVTQTTISGTTAGSATASMPWQGSTYKEVLVLFNGYENTSSTSQTYSFPVPFLATPAFTLQSDPPCTASTSTLSLPINMLSTYSGVLTLTGY